MQREEIHAEIVKILEEMFEIDPARATLDARLYEDLDIDSIDAVDLIVKLKKFTSKRMQPEAFKSVRTIGDVVNALYDLMQAQ